MPTSRTNVWCTGCGENGHYASECYKGPQKQVHFVDPETGVYYTIPDEDEEPEVNPVYCVQPVYGRGKGVTPLIRTDLGQKSGQIGPSQVVVQQRFPVGVCWNCGDPSYYASACPFRAGQGAPLPLPSQNCGEQRHDLPRARNLCRYDRCTSKWRFYLVNKPDSTTGAQPGLRIRVSDKLRWNFRLE